MSNSIVAIFFPEMKLKITIVGPKVHDVEYRHHLLSQASYIDLRGFNAQNLIADGQQQVEVLVEGDEDRTAELKERVETDRPKNDGVSSISYATYADMVKDLEKYERTFTNIQLDKGIQAILYLKETAQANSKIIERMDNKLEHIDANTALTPKILEEIKRLRDDQSAISAIRQLQQDMAAFKSQLNNP
jgi:acylphosphatase